MKVIFLQDVPNIAGIGETREVAEGFGRNYLIPQNLALPANSPEAARVAKQLEATRQKKEQELVGMAGQVEGKELTVTAKAGAKGRLYGSVTSADIAAELEKVAGVTIDKKRIEIAEPIRQLGSHEVVVRLGAEATPKVKVTVIAEETEEKAAEDKAVEKAKKKTRETAEAAEIAEPTGETTEEAVEAVEEVSEEAAAEVKTEEAAEAEAEAAEEGTAEQAEETAEEKE